MLINPTCRRLCPFLPENDLMLQFLHKILLCYFVFRILQVWFINKRRCWTSRRRPMSNNLHWLRHVFCITESLGHVHTKGKRKRNRKRSKNKRQTWRPIFDFAFTFARSEYSLKRVSWIFSTAIVSLVRYNSFHIKKQTSYLEIDDA